MGSQKDLQQTADETIQDIGSAEVESTKIKLESHRNTRQDALKNPPKYVIDNMFSFGELVVIAGESGTGKTWLTLLMAATIASGQAWLERKTEKAKVGYIDNESGEYIWHKRLVMVENGYEMPNNNYRLASDKSWNVHSTHFADINMLEDPNIIHEIISENDLDVLFIDALSAIHAGDENSTKDMTIVMNGLLKAARENNCAIVVIHHHAKNGGYRGSSLILNKCDSLYALTATDNQNVTLKSKKARNSAPVNIAAFHSWKTEPDEYKLIETEIPKPAEKAKSKAELARIAIVEFLEKNPRSRHSEIINALIEDGHTRSNITPSIKKLKDNKRIVQKNERYSLN